MCRKRKQLLGDQVAIQVSESLPFVGACTERAPTRICCRGLTTVCTCAVPCDVRRAPCNVRRDAEYELYRQLLLKLKVKGMNAVFDFRVQVCVGDTLILAVGSGTATYIEALPPPHILEVLIFAARRSPMRCAGTEKEAGGGRGLAR